jgi:dipeptidase D
MEDVIKDLKPEKMWSYFYEICQIPRESKHEEKITEWIINVAKELGLSYRQDSAGNVIISKPATPGYENAPAVVLQGHVDMVCEKNNDVVHDFRKDPIKIKREGNFITADGTTLGADNGIGVAAALAVLESKDIVHPPVEALFTVDEETGLTGASAISSDFVKGRILLNCDSEEEGALYIGCAGGKGTEISLNIIWKDAPKGMKSSIVKIKGLKGGHSGLDIAEQRANATQQLNRVIWNAIEKFNLNVYKIDGGSKHNAIPREADYKLLIAESELEGFKGFINEFEATLKSEFKNREPNLALSVEETDYPEKVFSDDFQKKILNLIYTFPHGVQKMSFDISDLVETSTNLAIVKTTDEKLEILTSQRSSVASEILDIADKVKACGLLAGGSVHQGGGYPAWAPNVNSQILHLMKKTYSELFDKEPEVKAIHAGLECGIIGDKIPSMDMISFGPTILGAHSPDERVEIKSVEKFWKLLVAVLKKIAEGK